jgi:vitamin B12 transporter
VKHPAPWRTAAATFAVFAATQLFAAPQVFAAAPVLGQAEHEPAAPAAEPAATVHEEIVVSAQADEAPRRRVGSSVTVIGRAEIEARRAVNVAELLRSVPGVEVSRSGPPGGNTSAFIRGANSSHTLVLVDGVRVNSPAVGGYDLAALSTDNVERVEVVRGPQSALYGSEAIGGVIAVYTRRGTGGALEGSAAAEAGTEESHRLATSWHGGGDGHGRGWDWSLAASQGQFDGVSSASEAAGNTETDPFRNTTASGLLGLDLAGGGRAELAVRTLDSATGLDGFAFGSGPVDDPNYRLDRRAVYANLRVETPVTARWTQHLRAGTAREELAATDPDTPFHPFATDTVVSDVVTQADLRLAGFDSGGEAAGAAAGRLADTLSLGAGFERRAGDSAGSFDESVDVASAFAENRLAWRDRLFVTAGVRWDDHSVFGAETTWRGTASWLAGGGARLHGSWGTGFKAPTFNELYFPGFGNPRLEPETSTGWDLGVEVERGVWRGDVTAFASDVDNLIDFDLATLRAENVAAARIRGVESQLAWLPSVPGMEARASWTWTDTEDRATGAPLARRPEHRGTLGALWDPAGRWDAALTLTAVADRVDSDGTAMDDYQRLDLTAGWRALPRTTLYLRLDNLLDDEAAEVNGFTTPGLVSTLGVRWAM